MLIFGTIRADSLRYMIHHVAGHVTCNVPGLYNHRIICTGVRVTTALTQHKCHGEELSCINSSAPDEK
jgi:hypothetical protein